MSQQAPVFPKVLLQGLRFRDFEAIKNLRLDLTRSFSRVFQGLFLPIRADLTKLRNAAFRLLGALCSTIPRMVCAGSPCSTIPRVVCAWRWWRGLDSNQRTLARADLQSAAFNHSATSPQRSCRSAWAGAPCGGAPIACQRAPFTGVPCLGGPPSPRLRRATFAITFSLACQPKL